MAANKIIRIGPVALTTTTTTNILNATVTSLAGPVGFTMTQPYLILRHIRITNKAAASAQAALWLGATGANTAGTETAFPGVASAGALTRGVVIPAQSYLDWTGILRMDVADFLVGGTDTATTLTFQAEAEIGLI